MTALELPRWSKRKPVARGLLVPNALRATIAKSLGTLEHEVRIKSSAPLYATYSSAGWGIGRQFAVGDAQGSNVAKAIEVLAKHDLPLTLVSLWYPPPPSDAGTATGAARMLKAALAAKAVASLRCFKLLLHRVKIDTAVARVLADAIERMTVLDELELRASGGTGITRIVGAARSLRSLGLFSVGANSSALRSIARSKNLASLEILALGDKFDDTAVEALLAAAFAPRLRSLHIVSDTPTTLPAIAELRALVDLRVGSVVAQGMTALASAPFVPNLRSLHIGRSTITKAMGKQIAARGLPTLEVLHVSQTDATLEALDPIVRAAPKLRLIEVPRALRVPSHWVKRGREIL